MSIAPRSKRFSNATFSSAREKNPKPCKICRSTIRWTLDKKLITSNDLGKTLKEVSAELPVTPKELEDHLPHVAKELVAPSSPEYGEMIIKSVQDIMRQAQEIVDEARAESLYRTALDGLKVMGALLTTQAKLLGHLKPDQKNSLSLNVSLTPKEVAKLADDYASTVVEIPDEIDNRRRTPKSDD